MEFWVKRHTLQCLTLGSLQSQKIDLNTFQIISVIGFTCELSILPGTHLSAGIETTTQPMMISFYEWVTWVVQSVAHYPLKQGTWEVIWPILGVPALAVA